MASGFVAYKVFSSLYALWKNRKHAHIKVFAANLWPLYDFSTGEARYNNFLSHSTPSFKLFLDSILLHDQIVIPTQDFMILHFLRSQLSESDLFELLESDCIRFCRLKGLLGYMNGHGISALEIHKQDATPDESTGRPCCGSLEYAIDWAISANNKEPKDLLLKNLIIEKTDEITAKSVIEMISHETFMDISNSSELRNVFSLSGHPFDRLLANDKDLRCISRNYSGKWIGDKVDIVLALAQTNLELYLAQETGCIDSSTASPVGHLIKSKAKRSFPDQDVYPKFVTLRRILDVPDIGESVLQKKISVRKLITLRDSIDGRQFRIWFHENCREKPIQTAKELFSLIKNIPIAQRLPVKILRFIVTSPLGPLAGAFDSFFVDYLLRGHSPKYFIEDLTQLTGKPRWVKDSHSF